MELILRRQMPNPPVNLIDIKESDDDKEVIFDEEQFLRQQSTAQVIPPSLAYTPPSPRLDVLGGENFDVNSPFGEYLDTLLTGDREIDFNPSNIETNDPVPDPRMLDVPLGNDDSMYRSFDVTISNLLFEFDDYFTLRIDNTIFDDDFEDLCSLDPLKETPLIKESILLVTPLPDAKQICLREVERFDPFFSLT
ncbi:hypothetical protein Tco_1081540 [Tanacetum coccineum]|uniref:NAC domain-containing protein n=1 Tax=Tanacetum coccineum TaxID=301880 RepID=A0ABQ5HXW2_9ASTR